MSKLIAVRVPDNLAETLSKNAEQTGQTVSQLVIQGLEMVLFNTAPVGKLMQAVALDAAKFIAAGKSAPMELRSAVIDATTSQTIQVVNPQYRPPHALDCKCLICKPPKP